MTTPGPGAALAARFHAEVVAPVLAAHRPGTPVAAGRLGTGSDVLGLDDATSTDHDWGLRLTLLLAPGRVADVDALLARELPASFAGHPVRFATTGDPVVRHRVEVSSVGAFARSRLGLDPAGEWDAVDWLGLTGQSVLEVTAGPVFTDPAGELTALRERLAAYPDDVWRYVVACAWHHLDQELPLVGRTGSRGDEVGSAVLAARLVRRAVHLGFLLDRRWSPYPEWAGTLFARTPSGPAPSAEPATVTTTSSPVLPHLRAVLSAATWQDRQEGLRLALEALLVRQRAVGLPTTATATVPFFDRPFTGIHPDLLDAQHTAIRDPAVRALPRGVGAVEQWVDGVDVLVPPHRRHAAVRAVLQAG